MAETPVPPPGAPVEPPAPPAPQPRRVDWSTIHLWQIQWVRDVLGILAIISLFWLGEKISVVTVPLLLAILLAYLFEPVIRWLMAKTAWERRGAVGAVMIAAILIVIIPTAAGLTFGVAQSIGFVEKVSGKVNRTSQAVEAGRMLERAERDVAQLKADAAALEERATEEPAAEGVPAPPGAAQSPPTGHEQPSPIPSSLALDEAQAEADRLRALWEYELAELEDEVGTTYRRAAEFIHEQGGETADSAFETLRRWIRANAEEIATAGAGALRTTLGFLGGLFGLLFMGFITAFFFFFIATGWVGFQRFSDRLLPEKHRERALDLLVKFDRVISAFIRGRLTIAFIQSIVFTIGYLAIGVPAAFILGPAVALLSIVPYLALVGVPISIVLIAAQGYKDFHGQWWWIVGAPTVFYFIAQALDDYVWTPMIQGKGTDMSTPMILFASLAGGCSSASSACSSPSPSPRASRSWCRRSSGRASRPGARVASRTSCRSGGNDRRSDHVSEIPPQPATQPPVYSAPPDPSGVRVPLLISAICNVLGAIAWGFGCITVVISVPLIVLCVFEFMQYNKLGDPARRAGAVESTRVIAILEICTVLLGNVPSMVCGILVLTNLRQLENPPRG